MEFFIGLTISNFLYIVILLILAGISIAQLMKNGLLKNAKEAKETYENAQDKENDIMTYYETLLGQYISNSRDTITISIEELTELIDARIQKSTNPTGSIIAQMGVNAPDGYLFCDGAIYNISEYSNLANYIKEQFGAYDYWGGDGTTTFAVPNLQGEFLRGYSENQQSSKTTGVSTSQVGMNQPATNHVGVYGDSSTSVVWQLNSFISNVDTAINKNTLRWRSFDGSSSASSISTYTSRPTNTSVLYCIKY